jgi:hypothetical protein
MEQYRDFPVMKTVVVLDRDGKLPFACSGTFRVPGEDLSIFPEESPA